MYFYDVKARKMPSRLQEPNLVQTQHGYVKLDGPKNGGVAFDFSAKTHTHTHTQLLPRPMLAWAVAAPGMCLHRTTISERSNCPLSPKRNPVFQNPFVSFYDCWRKSTGIATRNKPGLFTSAREHQLHGLPVDLFRSFQPKIPGPCYRGEPGPSKSFGSR